MSVGRSVVFGRGQDCDVVIPDEYASPRHARIWQDGGGRVWVEDLGSTNGTRIFRQGSTRSEKVLGPVQLYPGDSVRIGRTVLPWRVPE